MTLEEHFAYFTECQLATVEGLKMKKRSSKSEIRRHENIANKMTDVCRQLNLSCSLNKNPRLKERLTAKEIK
jgi:hypothetical protein